MSPFLAAIPRWADPARVAPLLAPGLAPTTARTLLDAERLRPRFHAWLDHQFGPTDPAHLDPADATALDALATDTAATRLITLAGAIWHAPTICGTVLAAEIAAFAERNGPDARATAIRHLATRPAITPTAGLDELEADGQRCVSAWLDTLPTAYAGRARLGWSDLPTPEDAHRAHGPAVIRLAATDLT